MKRIEFLDGLRGVAILLVVFFHAFARWGGIGNTFSEFLIFKYGYLGVQLFFLISGFVILMSLENSKNFLLFIYKRWLRLFPAMLIATVLIFFTSHFLFERPAGIPKLIDTIPGLLFTSPSFFKIITGYPIGCIEGAFWSIFVEFKFYVVFGIFYFLFGKIKSIIGIFVLFAFSMLGLKLNIGIVNEISRIFSFTEFGWFGAGSLAYLYFISKEKHFLIFSFLICLLGIYRLDLNIEGTVFVIILVQIFYLPIFIEKARIFLNNKFTLFFGLISYPLYLIHENAMIALIRKISKIIEIPYALLVIFIITFLVLIAYLIVKKLEPFVSVLIKKKLDVFVYKLSNKFFN